MQLYEIKEYIKTLYDNPENINWKIIDSQLNQFNKEYGYTYQAIKYVLWYAKEIKQMKLDGYGIGITPYLYDEAKAYYNKVQDIKKSIDEFENPDEIITIHKTNTDDIFK